MLSKRDEEGAVRKLIGDYAGPSEAAELIVSLTLPDISAQRREQIVRMIAAWGSAYGESECRAGMSEW